jgi:hypothetical protein
MKGETMEINITEKLRGSRQSGFKQIDITRAVRGAEAAGLAIQQIAVDHQTGKICLFTNAKTKPSNPNPCDRLLK